MKNHFHILLQTGKTSLSEFMQSVLTGYAIYYNWKHKRAGHVFQNRYKSIVCDKDQYLKTLVRYIHLSPVRAGVIEYSALENSVWTGHQEICRGVPGLIENKDEILGFFGERQKDASQNYRKFVKDGVGRVEDYDGGGLVRSTGAKNSAVKRGYEEQDLYDERILGNSQFIRDVYEKTDEHDDIEKEIPSQSDLLKRLREYYQIDEVDILNSRTKDVREARQMYVLLASR